MRVIKLTLILGLSLLLAFTIGCGGPPSSQDPGGASGEVIEITDQLINERINDARVFDVPPEAGETGESISWGFDEDEPKEITVIEKNVEGTKATIVLDIKTRSSDRSRDPRQLTGRITTHWELRTGWVLRRWEIVYTENMSMTYKKLPKPSPSRGDNNSSPPTPANNNSSPPAPPR
jgi:hypothetical protein